MSRTRMPRVLHALAVAIMMLTLPRGASADEKRDDKREAQALFSKALKQAEAGDNQGALASFRAAYNASPSYRVLYNIGQLCTRLADSVCTYRAYEQYLREGGSGVPAKRRTEVQAELQNLTKVVALVTISVSQQDAEVLVDDASIGKSPLPAPVAVSAGDHTIVARREDKSIDRAIKVAPGDAVSIDLQIPKDAPPPPAPPPAPSTAPEKAEKKPEPAKPVPIVPWAVTGALAVSTVVVGVLASSAYSDFKDKRDSFPVSRPELDDAQGKARDLFLVSAALGAATVVSAGVASYFTFLAPGGTSSTRVGLAVGPGTLMLRGAMP